MASASATSTRALSMEFKALQKEPVEGFLVTIPDDADFYTWQVAIFGPPDTPYAGGYFKVGLSLVGRAREAKGREGVVRGCVPFIVCHPSSLLSN